MTPTVAILAPGNMGAGVGARLSEHGVRVITALEGRSAASARRAEAAGMRDASAQEIASADFLLSIVPPGDALALAERLAPDLRASNHKPLYIDCNAVAPATVQRIAAVVVETGCAFIDGGIIGMPPRAGYGGPSLYVSGPDAAHAMALGDFGLKLKPAGAHVGDASALKMCYASLTKGFTALGAASGLAAQSAGVTAALRAELATSQPAMLAYLDRAVPGMTSKAYRWVAEMEEIGAFFGQAAEQSVLDGMARLYERLALDQAGPRREIDALARIFGQTDQRQ
jgi:3-hydroxyisobutyrate dehydrogenase-like beta-hydroxyacid dehydrogenase